MNDLELLCELPRELRRLVVEYADDYWLKQFNHAIASIQRLGKSREYFDVSKSTKPTLCSHHEKYEYQLLFVHRVYWIAFPLQIPKSEPNHEKIAQ